MPQPLHLPTKRGRLFAVLHPAAQPRAGVLVFPPFLQEHALSYRLFVLFAVELAKRNIAVLRLHYYGTGDSDGDDLDFSLDDACADADVALGALCDRIGNVPIVAVGARAGSFVAAALAARTHLHALWLWQPVTDGAAYLADLHRVDVAEQRSRMPFPNGGRARATLPYETLVGFPCSGRLFAELERARLRPSVDWPELTVLDRPHASSPLAPQHRIELPPALAAWESRLDVNYIPPVAVREVVARLVATMGDV